MLSELKIGVTKRQLMVKMQHILEFNFWYGRFTTYRRLGSADCLIQTLYCAFDGGECEESRLPEFCSFSSKTSSFKGKSFLMLRNKTTSLESLSKANRDPKGEVG